MIRRRRRLGQLDDGSDTHPPSANSIAASTTPVLFIASACHASAFAPVYPMRSPQPTPRNVMSNERTVQPPRNLFGKYHAHVYFDETSVEQARALCTEAAAAVRSPHGAHASEARRSASTLELPARIRRGAVRCTDPMARCEPQRTRYSGPWPDRQSISRTTRQTPRGWAHLSSWISRTSGRPRAREPFSRQGDLALLASSNRLRRP